jgi:two-component system, chemotaxis family, protein-glutamate methylesterase/glutaminase
VIELVVIGGSAGALEALLSLVPALPDELTLPLVVVLHLGYIQKNLVPEILRNVTSRPVVEADDKQPLRAGHIYIAPPNYHLLVERTRTLALSVDEPINFSRPSIDVLFESAADAYGARCVGLLLSGANEDGARGLERIADAGGRAFVQAPVTASQPTMPAAAARRLGDRAVVMTMPDVAKALARVAGAAYFEDRP